MAVFGDIIFFDRFAKSGNVFVLARATLAAPSANRIGDFFNLLFGKCNLLAGNLLKCLTRVYEKRLAGAFAKSAVLFVFGYEPKRNRKRDIVKKFRRAGLLRRQV